MKSEVLARDVSFSILFPDSYKTEPDKRYPVIYVLDGWYANGMGLFYNNAIGQRPFIQEFADQKRSSWCSMTTTPLSNGARTDS